MLLMVGLNIRTLGTAIHLAALFDYIWYV